MKTDDLIKTLTVASKAGIRSPDQLKVFLEIAKAGKTDILTLSGARRSTDPAAKRIASILKPLYEGYTVRISTGQMGIGLIRSIPGGTHNPGSTKPCNTLLLSHKGKRLIKKLGVELED